MPTNLEDADTGGLNLLFTDDLEGTEFKLRAASVWDAEEVRAEIEADTPQFGRWLPVETDRDGRGFAVAPGELIEELQHNEISAGEVVEVTRCQKSGDRETDPYEVNVEKVSQGQQQALTND